MTPKLTHEKTIIVDDLDRKQPLLGLSAAFMRQFPAPKVILSKEGGRTIKKETYKLEGRYEELEDDVLELSFVDPDKNVPGKAYHIVTHNGASWISIPRTWLRELDAQKGDQVEILSSPEQTDKLYLRLKKPQA